MFTALAPLVGRALAALRAARRTAVRRSLLAWATVRRTWRSSLQLRIVTITLGVSAALVGSFGVLVAQGITANLMDARQKKALEQVDAGAEKVTLQLQGAIIQPGDPKLPDTFAEVLALLIGPPEQAGSDVIAAIQWHDPGMGMYPRKSWPDNKYPVVNGAISDELRATVGEGMVAHQHRTVDVDGRNVTYLVYGAPIQTNSGTIELYYLFSLDPEVQAAGEVRRTVLITGAALVILLAVVAALVTRLVVRPVRLAARTAQRLSAGLLDQRMEVRGEDDLALLGAAFNQMAANLQRQIQRLEEMSRLQRRFTSDVSHELRTPLTTVRMAADLIFSERDSFDPATARSAELLQLELDRFEDLLTDLLEISRFDAGFAVLDAEPTDLTAILRRVAERLAAVAERSGSRIDLRLPDDPVIAELDARRVERILRNLVGNAVEHGEHKPVQVTLAADDGAVAVTVRDHGIGLKPGEEKLVFNRFWRADPSRARQTGGSGLGLSISLEDTRLHGGWLEAWGAPGQGALFRLTVPMRAGDRLVSSPLRLVPDDAFLDAAPPAIIAPRAPVEGGAAVPVGVAGGVAAEENRDD
jgi:two-component system sensor histidine kinase MtrB